MQNKTTNTLQAFWVGLGQLSAFSISIISTMILSRYFEKDDYGTYRQVIYIYQALLVIFSVGLPRAFSYFLPQQDMNQGKDIVFKISKVLFLAGLAFSTFLYFSASIIASMLKNPELVTGIKLFSPVPMLLLPTLGIEGIFATLRKTHIIAAYNVSTRMLMLMAVTLPVILFGGDYKTAIYGWVVSSFLTFLLALYLKVIPYRNIETKKSIYSFNDIFAYTLPIMQASLYGIALNFANQFYISRYFGPEEFAEYANGFIEIPFVMMITGAASTVLTPMYAKYLHQKNGIKVITDSWKNALLKSALIIYPMVIFFMFYAKEIMLVLYGDKYLASGLYFNIAIVMNFFDIIIIGSLLFAMGETKFYAKVFLISVLMLWGVDFLLVKLFVNPYLIAIAFVILRVFRTFIFLSFIAKKLGTNFFELFPVKMFARIIGHALAVVLFIKFIVTYSGLNVSVLLELIMSSIIFVVILLLSQKVVGCNYLLTAKELVGTLRK